MRVNRNNGKPAECIKFAEPADSPTARDIPMYLQGSEETLAQRVGLYSKPDRLLTQNEWEAVHGVARHRQDCLNVCAVCLEAFKNEPQVLLSCSHMFHAQCLDSFERHVRVRACPLCRKQWYQKHLIKDAAEAYQHACAARIQAVVRGWLCRRHLLVSVLRHAPPQAAGLKRHWAAGRLSEAGHALTALVQQGQDSLEQLFGELDASLQASRQLVQLQSTPLQAMNTAIATSPAAPAAPPSIFQQTAHPDGILVAQHIQPSNRWLRTDSMSHRQGEACESRAEALQQRQPASSRRSRGINGEGQQVAGSMRRLEPCANTRKRQVRTYTRKQPLNSMTADTADAAHTDTPAPQQSQGHPETSEHALLTQHAREASEQGHGVNDWEKIISRACQRGETECAICLCHLARRQQEGVALLSCSHTFHMRCIVSFEQFEQGRGGMATCPVCRGCYSKMCFAVGTGTHD